MKHSNSNNNSRIVKISEGIIGPKAPLPVSLIRRSTGAYPTIPTLYIEIAKNYSSPVLAGPPICDELIALVQHMYTEEEARIVRHIKPMRIKSAKAISRTEHLPIRDVQHILEFLTREKAEKKEVLEIKKKLKQTDL